MARVLVVLAAAAVAAAASSSLAGGSTRQTANAVCATHSFTMTFDPKRRVVLTDGGRVLASATFTSRSVSSRCRRVRAAKRHLYGGLGSAISGRTSFRCLTTQSIRVEVNPIWNRDTGAVVGSSVQVGVGTTSRMRVIVSAILKNKGDPYASRVFRAAANCKLGA
jgi:hypothetical protein